MTSNRSSALLRLSVLALAITSATPPRPALADALDDAFTAPPASARPWARWWWPGGAVTPQGLRTGVKMLQDGGFAGGEIQPFSLGLTPDAARSPEVNDYATPSFFSKVATAADEAKAAGLQLDYTFGSGWPSGGGATITPELALVELTMAVTTVEGQTPGPVRVNVPKRTGKIGGFSAYDPLAKDPRFAAWPQRIAAQQKVVAVIAVQGQSPQLIKRKVALRLFPWSDVVTPGQLTPGTTLVLTDKLKSDGTLDWTPPLGRWQILVFKQYVVDSGVNGGVGAGPQMVADHFQRAAFDAHARRVADPLVTAKGPRMAGLNGTFVDSLELLQDLPWSRDFLEQFKRRRGYDLAPYLPLILQPGWMQPWDQHYSPPYYEMGDLGERVREDYRQTVSDLLIDNYFAPFADWNRAHGLKSRLQAHAAPADILRAYGLADIPESEDIESGADPHYIRLARAAADHGGKTLVSAESFAFKEEPFDVALPRLRARADLLFVSGVNHLVEHGTPYPYQTEVWPGWYPFAPAAHPGFGTMIASANPEFPGMARLNAYVTRMQAVLRQGRNVVPVALYLGEIGYYHGQEAKGLKTPGPEQSLVAGGYDYDRINDDILTRSRVVQGALVSPGGMRFGALVFPAKTALRPQTAERVAAFAQQGLKVTFIDAPPSRALGLRQAKQNDRRVTLAMAKAIKAGAGSANAEALPTLLRSQGVIPNLTVQGPTPWFIQRQAEGRSIYFLHNAQAQTSALTLTLPVKGRVEQWDAWTGEKRVMASTVMAEGTQVSLTLAGGASALLVVGGPEAPPSPPAPVGETTLVAVEGLWTYSVTGHGSGGRELAAPPRTETLADWRQVEGLADVSGVGVYRKSFDLPSQALSGRKILVDLGTVGDVAAITLNGKAFGTEIGPFVFDVTDAVKAGQNDLVVTVANSPNNAFVGPKAKKLTARPAGLIGPVRVTTAP